MSLKLKIQDDWKTALKSKNSFKVSVLTMVKAAILKEEKDRRIDSLIDEDVVAVVSREVKQRRDSLVEFEKGNRKDLVDQTNEEIEILLEYLPRQLTKDEIESIIIEAVKEVSAKSIKDMGKVMSNAMPKLKGKADGKLINELVKEILNK